MVNFHFFITNLLIKIRFTGIKLVWLVHVGLMEPNLWLVIMSLTRTIRLSVASTPICRGGVSMCPRLNAILRCA